MIITANAHDLANALSRVNSAASKQATMPILKHIYVEAENGLTLKATDLEIGIETTAEVNVERTGKIVLPVDVVNIINALDGRIRIEVDNYTTKITSNGSRYKLNCYDADEFPELPEVEDEKRFSVDNLQDILRKCEISISNDQTQPSLTGMYIGEEAFVSTNTYRLSLYRTPTNIDRKMIIPQVTVKELIGAEITDIIYSNNYIKFICEDKIITSRLIEGDSPNWKAVVTDEPVNIKVDRQQLLSAVKRANVIGEDVIKLEIESDKLHIRKESDYGKAHEIVECNSEIELSINVNGRYLSDGLRVLNGDVVEIAVKDKLSPLHIIEDNFKYVVMPVRGE